MTNYLLSIDPSIKNTGFTLWEHIYQHCKCFSNCNNIDTWKPIFSKSYSFKIIKENDYNKFYNFKQWVDDTVSDLNSDGFDNLNLIIERGTFHSKNGIGYETQEHLRGFIAGQFNKLLTKDMLISPKEWQNWYLKKLRYEEDDLFKDKKWNKEKSLYIVGGLIRQQNWNIKISNHDEADSLLIGWYYLNKENK